MAIDGGESPSPTCQSPSHFSQPRHFYVAVDRLQFKMETLVDLLGVAGRRPGLPMIVCCSSRDELDAVCSAVSNLAYISFSSLHSDLAERERMLILEEFRHTTMKWNQKVTEQCGDKSETGKDEHKSHMIVVTDACLPLLSSGESAISARVLINYELPTKKETYIRRMTTCIAADGIMINMVVGGEVVTLRSLEESLGLIVAEMPINTADGMAAHTAQQTHQTTYTAAASSHRLTGTTARSQAITSPRHADLHTSAAVVACSTGRCDHCCSCQLAPLRPTARFMISEIL